MASISVLIAIVSVLVSWYRNTQKPLKIIRTIVHKNDKTTFILVIKNVKPYPVVIKNTDCYRKKKYEIQKKYGEKPEYSELLLISEKIFSNEQMFEIPANSHTDIQIRNVDLLDIPTKLLFLLKTSHGYHELWCKQLTIIEIGKTKVHGLEYKYDFESKWHAKAVYHSKKFKEIIRRLTVKPK